MTLRLCKDCKHHSRIYGTALSSCNNPGAVRDPVGGRAFAGLERIDGRCGYQALLFEPKRPRKPWLARIFGERFP
jgi:hypothetical protein